MIARERWMTTLAVMIVAVLPLQASQPGLLVDETFANDGIEESATMLEDDFSAGQGDWVIRGENVRFEEEALLISPQANSQPGAAYLSFDPVTLRDGEFLRVTANVSVGNQSPRPRDIRMGLGFASPLIEGDSEETTVSLKGYYVTAPSGGNTTNPEVQWVRGGSNFFNPNLADTSRIGSNLTNSQSLGADPASLVWEVRRSGTNLIFSGSLDGVAFGTTVAATGERVIPNYRFNTLGLAYLYSPGETATFDGVKVETATSAIRYDWAIRGNNVRFEDEALKISPGASGNAGQPGAAYLAFDPVVLEDGEFLRLTVDVAVSHPEGKPRDVRIGLGHADPNISGQSGGHDVPLTGYYLSAPSGGNTTNHRLWWNNAGSGTRNFFNSSTSHLGDLANSESIGAEKATWVWEVKRSGETLVFTSSLAGQSTGSSVTASGNAVIGDFRFNTVGLAYAYTSAGTATYDNLKIETNSVRGVGTMAEVGGRFGSVRFIEIREELTHSAGVFELGTAAVGEPVYFDDTVAAAGEEAIESFRFNTIGLGYAYSPGETGTFGSVKVETGTDENSVVVFDENFAGGQGDWATRGNNVRFEEAVLKVGSGAAGQAAQPGAAYLSFDPVDLSDGEFLRVSMEVAVSNANPRLRDLRVGLGYAHSEIAGDETGFQVPLTGYFVTAPSGGETADFRVTWNDAGTGTKNFFNSVTRELGEIRNTRSVGTELVPWVWEIRRSGDALVFTSGLDGEDSRERSVITSLPPELEGKLAIKTSNYPEHRPSKNLEPYLGLVVDLPTTLTVAYDAAATVPLWLSNHYIDTGEEVTSTGGAFRLWSRELQARETVVLLFDSEALEANENNFWVLLSHGPEAITESPDLFFARSAGRADDWRLDPHHWTLTTEAGSDPGVAGMMAEITDFDPGRGFSLTTHFRVPLLQESGERAFGFALLGESDGIRAEWLVRQADGTSILRLVEAASGDVLQSEPWTGLMPTAIDNDVGVGSGATETVFAAGTSPFSGGGSNIIFAEDFEGDVSGWTTGSNTARADEWEIGDRTDNGAGGAYGGQKMATTGFDGYGTNSDFWLRSPLIDLTARSNIDLGFQEYVDLDWEDSNGNPFHYGVISVLDADTLEKIEELGISRSHQGQSSAWSRREFNLSAFAGRRIVLEFRLVSDNFSWSGDGWFIDDIEVAGEGITISSLPEALAPNGALNGIATDRDEVDATSAAYLQFTVVDRGLTGNEGVTVYVAWDVRGSGLEPAWLRDGFALTDHAVFLTGGGEHRLWAREYEDGATVTLGGASAAGGGPFPPDMSNYFVLFADARSGLEEVFHLTSQGTLGEAGWTIDLSLADVSGHVQTIQGTAAASAEPARFGILADQVDGAIWEVFDLTIDFLDEEDLPGFEAWREQHFAGQLDQPEISGPDASPAGDGVANLIKYAMNLSPWEPVVTEDLVRLVSDEPGLLVLVYWERTDVDDVEYLPEVSTDLMHWEAGAPHVEKILLGTDGNMRAIEARGNVPVEAGKGFMRLKINRKE